MLKETELFKQSAIRSAFIDLVNDDNAECFAALFDIDNSIVTILNSEYEAMTNEHPNRKRLIGGVSVKQGNKTKLVFICTANSHVKREQFEKYFENTDKNINVRIQYKKPRDDVFFAAKDEFIIKTFHFTDSKLDTLYLNYNGRVLKQNSNWEIKEN